MDQIEDIPRRSQNVDQGLKHLLVMNDYTARAVTSKAQVLYTLSLNLLRRP